MAVDEEDVDDPLAALLAEMEEVKERQRRLEAQQHGLGGARPLDPAGPAVGTWAWEVGEAQRRKARENHEAFLAHQEAERQHRDAWEAQVAPHLAELARQRDEVEARRRPLLDQLEPLDAQADDLERQVGELRSSYRTLEQLHARPRPAPGANPPNGHLVGIVVRPYEPIKKVADEIKKRLSK